MSYFSHLKPSLPLKSSVHCNLNPFLHSHPNPTLDLRGKRWLQTSLCLRLLVMLITLSVMAASACAAYDPKTWSPQDGVWGTDITVTPTVTNQTTMTTVEEGGMVWPGAGVSLDLAVTDKDAWSQRYYYALDPEGWWMEYGEVEQDWQNSYGFTYTWSCTGGSLVDYGSYVHWTAPQGPGTYTINCTIDDAPWALEWDESGSRDDDPVLFSRQIVVPGDTWSPLSWLGGISSSGLYATQAGNPVASGAWATPGQALSFTTSASDYDTAQNQADVYGYNGTIRTEEDTLTYTWTASGGVIEAGTDPATATWTPPATPDTYTITCRIDDVATGLGPLDDGSRDDEAIELTYTLVVPKRTWGPDTGLLTAAGGAPVITSPSNTPQGDVPRVAVNTMVALEAEAVTDLDSWVQNTASGTGSDPISYQWTAKDAYGADAGNFPNGAGGRSLNWVAPTTPGTYTLTCTVEDIPTAVEDPDEGARDDNGWTLTQQITVSQLDSLQYMDLVNNPTWQDVPAGALFVPVGTQLAFQAVSDHGFPTAQPVWSGDALTAEPGVTNPPAVSCDTLGSYTLRATCGNFKETTITVVEAGFGQASAIAKVGQQVTLEATVNPVAAAAEVVFESADASVATVQVTGTQAGTVSLSLTGVSLGTTEVQARLGQGANAPILATLNVWVNRYGLESGEVIVQPAAHIRNSDETCYQQDGKNRQQVPVPGHTVEYKVRVRNDNISEDNSGSDTLHVTGPEGVGGWSIHYFEDTEGEITAAVVSQAGWSTGLLAEGQSREVTIRITPPLTIQVADEYYVGLTVTSGRDATTQDSVVASAIPLLPPLDLSIDPATTARDRQLSLSWSGNDTAIFYKIYRRTGTTGSFIDLDTVACTEHHSFVDRYLHNNIAYYYKVQAINAKGEYSADSPVITESTLPLTPPTMEAEGGDKHVALSWAAVTRATNYRIYRAAITGTAPNEVIGSYALIGTATTLGFTNNSLINGRRYSYKVRAWNSGGESSDSNIENELVQGPPPEAPVLQTPTAGDGRVALRWTASEGALNYRVYRAPAVDGNTPPTETDYQYLLTTNGLSYVDAFVSNGTTYFYRVTAADAVPQEGGPSNAVYATPGGASADLMIRTLIETDYTGWHLYDTDGSGQSKEQATSSLTPAVYILKLVNNGEDAQFKVRATAGNSTWQVKYFSHVDGGAQHEITGDVTGNGWLTPTALVEDGELLLRVEVTPIGTVAEGVPYPVVVTAENAAAPTETDAVRAVTRRERQVKRLEYSVFEDNDWTQWQPVPAPGLQVPIGTTARFKAIMDPENESWPAGKPVWGGSLEAGASEADGAITEPILLDTASTPGTPFQITAACDDDNVLAAPVTVVQITELQYSFNGEAFQNIPAAGLTIITGTTVRFKAFSSAGAGVWPPGKPLWAGVTALAGSFEETPPVQFDSTLIGNHQLTAACGNEIPVPLRVVKSVDVKICNEDSSVWGTTATGAAAPLVRPAVYRIRVTNAESTPHTYKLAATVPGGTATDWSIRYFDSSELETAHDITDAMTNSAQGGWPTTAFTLPDNTTGSNSREIWVRVLPGVTVPQGAVQALTVTASSITPAAGEGSVTATTTRDRELIGLEYSFDGENWAAAPTDANGVPLLPEGMTVGIRAVKANPNQPWPAGPLAPYSGPAWNIDGHMLSGETIWRSFDPATGPARDLKSFEAQNGESASTLIKLIPNYRVVVAARRSQNNDGTLQVTATVKNWSGVVQSGAQLQFNATYDDGSLAGSFANNGSMTSGSGGTATCLWTPGAKISNIHFSASVIDSYGAIQATSPVTLAYQSTVTNTPDPAPTVEPPLAPTVSVGTVTDTAITLSWVNTADIYFDEYRVYRATTDAFTPGADNLIFTSILPDVTSYTDSDLEPATTYHYKVVKVDAIGTSEAASATVTTAPTPAPTPTPTLPAAPAAVTLSVGTTTNTAVSLTWTASTHADFDSYEVHRATTANFTPSDATFVDWSGDAASISITNAGLLASTTYYYKVLITDFYGQSTASNEVSATTTASPVTPSQPAAPTLTVATPTTPDQASLSWTQSGEGDFSKYELHRAETANFAASDETRIQVYTSASTLTATDTWLTPGATYYYQLVASNDTGLSTPSNEVSVTMPTVAAPAAVTVTAGTVTGATAAVSWTKSLDSYFSHYELHRSTAADFTPAEETHVQSVYNADTLRLTDIAVDSGVEYFYKVVVYNRFGQLAASDAVSLTTTTDPPPSTSTAVTLSAGALTITSNPTTISVALSWTKNEDVDFLEYDIYRSLSQAGYPSAPSDDTYYRSFFDHNTLSFTDTGLLRGGTYHYTIVVRNKTLAGPATSNTVTVNVPK